MCCLSDKSADTDIEISKEVGKEHKSPHLKFFNHTLRSITGLDISHSLYNIPKGLYKRNNKKSMRLYYEM